MHDETSVVCSKTRSLPHHPVFHHAKSNKVNQRIEFDVTAKYKSLHSTITFFRGLHLTNEVADVLLRFRIGEVPIVADVADSQ